jgi:hypothetical protein
VAGIIPLNKDRKTEIYLGVCECKENTTGMSEWLGLISIKEYVTQGGNQVLEATPQSQLMEISYDVITRYHHRRPSLAKENLLVEISWRNIKHLSLCQTNDYVLFRMRELQKDP